MPPVKPGIVVHMVGRGDNIPELAWLIEVSSTGQLHNMMSHRVSDESLKKGMWSPGKKKRVLIRVQAADEATTMVATLIGAVERIKRSADPEAETVIYVYFQSLRGSKGKRD